MTKRSKARQRPDWTAIDALSDEQIAAQIAANPDAAPDVSGWSLDDPGTTVVEPLDVRALRTRLGMSQATFAATFGLNLAALRDWEQQRRVPRGPARTLLRIIAREPEAARRALANAR